MCWKVGDVRLKMNCPDKTDYEIRWHDGSRRKFALSLMRSRANVQLLDHVGLRHSPFVPAAVAPKFRFAYPWRGDMEQPPRGLSPTAKKARLLIANSEYTAQKSRARYPDLPTIRVCWPGKDPAKPHTMHRPQGTPVNSDAALRNRPSRHADSGSPQFTAETQGARSPDRGPCHS